jgi:hypothetical protein
MRRWFLMLAIALTFAGCGKWDSLDADDFDLFGSDDKKDIAMRTYALPGMSSAPLVQFLVDDSNVFSRDYEKDVRKTCDYAKLPYRAVDLKTWSASPSIMTSTRVICVLDTKN